MSREDQFVRGLRELGEAMIRFAEQTSAGEVSALSRKQIAALRALGFCHHRRVYCVATEPAKVVVCLECGGVEENNIGPCGRLAGDRSWRFPTHMEDVCAAFGREIVGPTRGSS